MIVYGIGSSQYPANDGAGAELYGGRWNDPGTPIIYTSDSIASCALEILAHAGSLADDSISVAIEIPDSIAFESVIADDLPDNWRENSSFTAKLGTLWADAGDFLVLNVPSSILPQQRNYLINPRHCDFGQVKFSAAQALLFDERLKRLLP